MTDAKDKHIRHKYKWVIDGVTREKLQNPQFSLESDPISIQLDYSKTEWKACIQTYKGCLSVYLMRMSHFLYENDFLIECSIRLHDVTTTIAKRKISEYKVNLGWGTDKFIILGKLFDKNLKYLKDGSILELAYDIQIYVAKKANDAALTNNHSKFLNDTTLADFTLVSSDGEQFHVHRTFLADASEFFHKLFTIDMKGMQNVSIKFEEFDSETMKTLLDYIYTGNTAIEDSEKATKVIYAADKFMLPGLKEICAETLEDALSKENAIEILTLADMYCMKELEDACLKMIINYFEDVKQSEGWKSLTLPLSLKIIDALVADSIFPQACLHSSL